MSYILCVYLLTFFFIPKRFQPQDTTGALSYWPFFKFQISILCNCLPISATADVSATLCISHLQDGFVLLLHMFNLPLLKFFLTSFSTVEHLLTLVHLGQFAVPFVGVVSSVATAQPWAVMCVGDTTLTHHFTDIVRDRNQGCVAEGCILF